MWKGRDYVGMGCSDLAPRELYFFHTESALDRCFWDKSLPTQAKQSEGLGWKTHSFKASLGSGNLQSLPLGSAPQDVAGSTFILDPVSHGSPSPLTKGHMLF